MKIIRKGQNSRDVSPLFLRNRAAAKERPGAKELKQLLEANARWNVTRRDISDSELRRVVDETSTINPELRKELLYSWERGFIEDKQTAVTDNWSGSFLRKHEQRKSGKALMIPLKGEIVSETPSTVKTAAGAVYRKSDIAKSRLPVQSNVEGSEKKKSPTGGEPRSKQQKTVTQYEDTDSESAEEHDINDQGPRDQVLNEDSRIVDKFQNSPIIVTSKETETGGGLNLGRKGNKPNRAGPLVQNQKSCLSKSTTQEPRKSKAAKTVAKESKKRDTGNAELTESSTSKKVPESKRITRQTNEKDILNTFQNKDMTPDEWDDLTEQVLTRGVQKEAEQILTQQAGPINTCPPPGFSDESDKEEDATTVRRSNRQTKNQGPKRYGSPVSHSVKLISCEDDITDLNLANLEAYRTRLATFNPNNKETTLENNTFGLLERHLFKRRFGATSLDVSGSWNAVRNKAELKKKNKGK